MFKKRLVITFVLMTTLLVQYISGSIYLGEVKESQPMWMEAVKEARAAEAGRSPFVSDAIYFHSDAFAGRTISHGIDVSKYQYNINWEAVAKTEVEYAFIRVGYRGYGASGTMCSDEYFEKNMEGAITAGIDVGVYFFSQATTEAEAVEEAKFVLGKIAGYPVNMPVVLDVEFASVNGKNGGRLYDAKLSKEKATNVCLAFCKTIEEAGYEPMIYANTLMLNNNLNASKLASKYKIWLANYVSLAAYTGTYDFWQYTSKGKVNGISGNVDCNFWYQKAGEGNNDTTQPPASVIHPISQVTGLVSTERTDTQIHLLWDLVEDISGYEIYRYNYGNGIYELVHTVENGEICAYTDTGLVAGTTYDYKICAYRVNSNGSIARGNYSAELSVMTAPRQVTGFDAGGCTTNRIRLNWDFVDEITGYCIYRYNLTTKEFQQVAVLDSAITTWVDTTVKPGKEYEYTIKTYIKEPSEYTYFGPAVEPITVKTKPAKVSNLTFVKATQDKIRLEWKPVEGADGYRIYRYDSATKKYKKMATLGKGTASAWVDKNLKKNTSYKYRIVAYVQWSDKIRLEGAVSDTVTAKTKK